MTDHANLYTLMHAVFAAPSKIGTEIAEALEWGDIIYLPTVGFSLREQEQHFLSAHVADPRQKNISYDHRTHRLSGIAREVTSVDALQTMICRYTKFATELVHGLLPSYQSHLEIARTSFRPVEIDGRESQSYRKDDTRLHVDAFPATPNQGKRILRVFTNINHFGKARVWRVGERFPKITEQFLKHVPSHKAWLMPFLKKIGITRSLRTHYDHIMLHIHHAMKRDKQYQQSAMQQTLFFPPDTTWIAYTDTVSHAAMSGQHVLEQTFMLPVEGMVNMDMAPLKILETRLCRSLV